MTWTLEEGIGVVLRLREVRMSLAGFLDLPLLLTGGMVNAVEGYVNLLYYNPAKKAEVVRVGAGETE